MGRRKIYTSAKAFEKAVDGYFEQICCEKPLTEKADSGERTSSGKAIMIDVPVLDAQGRPRTKLCYLRPPSITALCRHIGVSLDTWENYASDRETYPGYAEICADARTRVRAYLEEELLTREKVQGVIFALENNYGMRAKADVQVHGGLERYLEKLDEEGIEPAL